jgi:hypothetical protein
VGGLAVANKAQPAGELVTMSSNNIVFFQADFPTSITSVGDWHRSGTDAKAGSAAIAEKLSRAPLLLVMPKALKRTIEQELVSLLESHYR